MQIILPPDIEAIAEQAVRSGSYNSVAEFVAETIRKNAEAEATKQSDEAQLSNLSYEQWQARFHEYLQNRRQTNGVTLDDSRESMYPDRS